MLGSWIVDEPAAGTAIVDEPWALPIAQFAVTLAFSVKVPPPEPRETAMWTTRSFVAPGASGPTSFHVRDDLVTESAFGSSPRMLNTTPRVAVMLSTTLTPVSVQARRLCTWMMPLNLSQGLR